MRPAIFICSLNAVLLRRFKLDEMCFLELGWIVHCQSKLKRDSDLFKELGLRARAAISSLQVHKFSSKLARASAGHDSSLVVI